MCILHFAFCHFAFAQSIAPSVIGSTGNYSSNASLSISSTVGEPMITTLSTSSVIITQGFQQPTVTSTLSVTATATPTVICSGSSSTLSANVGLGVPPYSYSWSPSASLNFSNISNPVANPTITTTYSVVVTDINLLTGTATVTLTVNPTPTVSISAAPSYTICSGQNASLAANVSGGTSPFSYTWSTTQTTSGIVVSPTGFTAYGVNITDAKGCTNTAGASININSTPTITVSAPITICGGVSATLNATSNGTSYQWNPGGQTTSSLAVTPTSAVSYTVTAAIGTCSTSATTTVTGKPALTSTITPTNATCAGTCNGIASAAVSGGYPGYIYLWNDAQTQTTSAATGLCASAYSLQVKDLIGCVNNFTIAITEPIALSANPTGTSTSCPNACDGIATSNPLGGTTPYTYLWSNLQTTSAATGLCAGTYTLTLKDANACSNSFIVSVGASGTLPSPTVTATATTLCSGTSTTLTASGGATYSWNIVPVQTTSSIVVAPTANASYTVTVFNSGGCSKDTSISITVNSIPVPLFTAPAVCYNNTTVFTDQSTGAVQWYWNFGDGNISSSQNPVHTYSTSGTHTVTLVVTNATGCKDSISINDTVYSPPAVSISGNNFICSGQTDTLTAVGGDTYVWNTSQTVNPLIISPASTTAYTVTATDSNGCTNAAIDSIHVTTAPNPNIIPSATTLCAGDTVTLTASGGANYSWSTGQTATTVSAILTNAGTFTFAVTASNGSCSASDSVSIIATSVNLIIAGDTNVCVGNTITLSASGGITYSWFGPNGFNSSLSSPSVTNATTADAGTYSVTVSNANGCSASKSITVAVAPIPSPSILCSDADSSVCIGSGITLTASGGTTYLWSTGQTTASISPTILANATYSVTAFNGNCSATASIPITALPLPNILVSASPSTICSGDVSTLTASGGVLYSWSPLNISGTISVVTVVPASSITYTVYATNNAGCAWYNTANVTVSYISANAGGNITVCPGFTAHLLATVSGDTAGINYLWYPGSTLNDSTTENPSANPSSATSYTVEVHNQYGCYGKDSLTVFVVRSPECVIHIYNGITPNGDGNNDVWWIDGIQSFPDNSVSIFNRWGSEVWRGTNYDNEKVVWKGQDQQGHDLPDGTYYYVVKINTDSESYTYSKWVEITR